MYLKHIRSALKFNTRVLDFIHLSALYFYVSSRFPCNSSGCVTPNKGFSIVTFNTHLGGVNPDFKTLYPLSDVTARMPADVMVFQEVVQGDNIESITVPSTARVFSKILDPSYSRVINNEERKGSLSTFIASSLPVLDEMSWVLAPFSQKAQAQVQLILLETSLGKVWFAGVHLSAQHVPLLSTVHFNDLSRKVKMLTGKGLPVIVAGDHNLWGRVVRPLAPKGAIFASKSPTWPSSNVKHCIDHVWGTGVKLHGFAGANVGSDHLPVFAHVTELSK